MKIKNKFVFTIFSCLIFSLNSISQTISLSDFNENAAKAKSNSQEELKLKRDNQKGISINFYGSLVGPSKMIQNNLNSDWKRDQILIGYDIRVSYSKESIIPFGIYTGYGSTNLFLGGGDTLTLSGKYSPATSNYFIFGISKNIGLSSTIYLGYVKFEDVERTNIFQTTNLEENMGINVGYSIRLKNLVVSLDNIIHLPYYKDSQITIYHPDYNFVDNEKNKFNFGNRLQIGLGYLF